MSKHEINITDLAPLDEQSALKTPFAGSLIKAGFPSPAEDYLEPSIDLNKELIHHPASTFFGRASGESMNGAGIDDGDILIIDKALEPFDGAAAVCFLDGNFTLKFIKKKGQNIWLIPANQQFKPIKVTTENEFLIWGIVTYVIKKAARLPHGISL